MRLHSGATDDRRSDESDPDIRPNEPVAHATLGNDCVRIRERPSPSDGTSEYAMESGNDPGIRIPVPPSGQRKRPGYRKDTRERCDRTPEDAVADEKRTAKR